MQHTELSITIENFNRTPMMTVSGMMDSWHDEAVEAALSCFVERSEKRLVLDITQLAFGGADGQAALIKSLRSVPPEIDIDLVATEEFEQILQRANLGPCIKLSSNFSGLAEGAHSEERYLTSRWVPKDDDVEELPLAA